MYEFDEQHWDGQKADPGDQKGLPEGWLIERAASQPGGEETDAGSAVYLQIGTGQWCGAAYATLFPLRGTAVVYAKEFGFTVGKSVRIVRHRF